MGVCFDYGVFVGIVFGVGVCKSGFEFGEFGGIGDCDVVCWKFFC